MLFLYQIFSLLDLRELKKKLDKDGMVHDLCLHGYPKPSERRKVKEMRALKRLEKRKNRIVTRKKKNTWGLKSKRAYSGANRPPIPIQTVH